ncbi:hypothetical protein HZ994_17755 [Akkermansiaceae bacterium]|nr:hypothetical protein HZ994_17755 [Akkermansiaceae bacterium]
MKKPQKQLLSVMFHLAVLCGMVVTYDAGKALAQKLGWIKSGHKAAEGTAIDFMDKEPQLSTEIDPALEKLVAKKDGTFLFRTDIPFPPHLRVISTDVTKFHDVNIAKRVADGSQRTRESLRIEEVMEYEMAGKSVRFTQRQMLSQRKPTAAERLERLKAIEAAVKKGAEPPADPFSTVGELVGKAVQFKTDGKAWAVMPTKEFKTMAWGKGLEKQVGDMLVANGLMRKARWFGDKPLPIGHKLTLSGDSLDLVLTGGRSGSLDMELKGMEGVHGHPCAVFEVSGAVKLDEDTDDQGRTTSGEETIESGRIWFSLLYPVVLRGEMAMIVSYDTREKGKLVEQLQGKAEKSFHRKWGAVTKAAPKE